MSRKRKTDANDVDIDVAEKTPKTPNSTSAPRKRRKIATAMDVPVTIAKRKRATPSSSYNASQALGSAAATLSQSVPRRREKTGPPVEPGINSLPTTKVSIFAFGTGYNAELGLGPEPTAKVVKRSRLNAFLLPDTIGVVAVAIGGMHGLALIHEGKVYSWGVNYQYALGRESKVAPCKEHADDETNEEKDDETNNGKEEPFNALESTPMQVDGFPEGTVIMRIAAGDSVSVAVTDKGRVYASGTGDFSVLAGIPGM